MGSAVDPTGLSFTVTKKDGTTASVSPQTHTPTTWGDTAGTQTCTFTYTDGYDSVSCEVEANVQEALPTITGITLTANTGTQTVGQPVDYSGMSFELALDTGDTGDVDGEYLVDGALIFTSSAISGGVWTDTGSQSLTITINDQSSFWSEMGAKIASPAPSTTATVTVEGSGSSTTLYVGDSGTNTIEFSESVSSGVNYVGFFVDLGTGNPIEVDEGDVFWYFASDTDYQGDASLADVLTSMPDDFDAIGINVDTPEMVALTGPHISDQEWKIPLKGTGTLSASDTYHFVLAQAPTGTTADTSVVTFKCSDLVELDRQVVVFEPGHAPSP